VDCTAGVKFSIVGTVSVTANAAEFDCGLKWQLMFASVADRDLVITELDKTLATATWQTGIKDLITTNAANSEVASAVVWNGYNAGSLDQRWTIAGPIKITTALDAGCSSTGTLNSSACDATRTLFTQQICLVFEEYATSTHASKINCAGKSPLTARSVMDVRPLLGGTDLEVSFMWELPFALGTDRTDVVGLLSYDATVWTDNLKGKINAAAANSEVVSSIHWAKYPS